MRNPTPNSLWVHAVPHLETSQDPKLFPKTLLYRHLMHVQLSQVSRRNYVVTCITFSCCSLYYYFFCCCFFHPSGSVLKLILFCPPWSWQLLLMMTGSRWSPIKPWWKLLSCSPLPFPFSLRRSTGKWSLQTTFRTVLSDRHRQICHDNVAVAQEIFFFLANSNRGTLSLIC